MVLFQRRKTQRTSFEGVTDGSGRSDTVVKISERITDKHSFLTSRRLLFPFGILLGVVLCILATSPYHSHLLFLIEQYELPRFPELDWANLESEWGRLRSQIPEPWKLNKDGREFQVGEAMHARGLKPEHPIVLIPGIISTSLESWSTSPDYRSYFREKLWGGFHMLTQVMLNREKWISAIMLDPDTGLDPPDVKLRAAEGVDAASSFIQGYWIWSKIIENLAAVGYDTNSLNLAAYDWRLSFYNLEVRDGYFSRLKTTIEGFKRREKRKVVLAAHSMGATVCSSPGREFSTLIFCDTTPGYSVFVRSFKWVEAEGYGNGGPTWVEDHIEAFISIAGTLLPKALTAFLSGEMKDTVEVNPAGAYVLERFFSRQERARLFRSWAGSASMWIKGGSAIWGNSTWAPDDFLNCTHTHGQLVAFRATSGLHEPHVGNLTAEKASDFILGRTPASFQRMMATNYSFGIQKNESILVENDKDHTKWTNPLESRLPYAPSMKIYCVYGHGKETERSYWYTRGDYEYNDALEPDIPEVRCDALGSCTSQRPPLDMPLSRRNWIDTDITDDKAIPKTKNGVRMGEGDGTVALISLGALCVEGWKRSRWNPANISVVTYELPHLPQANIPRGGATTSDHVDILGSTGLNEVILKVATGVGQEIQPQYGSSIREYAARMDWD